ncbi:MAG: hypothetical protein C4583_05710 [Anaerolineaceae bacterium]|nr:MAG: hypothetical protein C4583_05710 [Anaerolineaceae bacterium]
MPIPKLHEQAAGVRNAWRMKEIKRTALFKMTLAVVIFGYMLSQKPAIRDQEGRFPAKDDNQIEIGDF